MHQAIAKLQALQTHGYNFAMDHMIQRRLRTHSSVCTEFLFELSQRLEPPAHRQGSVSSPSSPAAADEGAPSAPASSPATVHPVTASGHQQSTRHRSGSVVAQKSASSSEKNSGAESPRLTSLRRQGRRLRRLSLNAAQRFAVNRRN
jgi:hypothetical protein